MTMGRPTKYKPEYCEEIITYVKEDKYSSLEGFCAEIGICEDTLSNWRKEHPDFFGAVKIAKQVLAARAIKRLMKCAEDSTGNATANIFAVKNLARDWQDKVQNELTGANGGAIKSDVTLSPETLTAISKAVKTLDAEY